jgi:glutathione S-transferase
MAITLYRPDYEGSQPTWRVELTLVEKRLEYREVRVSFGSKPASLLEINPRGQVPALEDGEVRVFETNAILEYLDHAYPDTPLLPRDSGARARALTRLNEVSNYLMSAFMGFWRYRMSTKPEGIDPAKVREFSDGVRAEWDRWEGYLAEAGGAFFVAGALSLVDLSVEPYLAGCVRNGLALEERYPALSAFHRRMLERESVQRTWPRTWKDTPGEALFG